MAALKSRLYEMEMRKRNEAINAAHEAKGDAGWGNQIRSYVLQPYQMVKDLRSNVETSDTQGVLDGDLDAFMAGALAAQVAGKSRAEAQAEAEPARPVARPGCCASTGATITARTGRKPFRPAGVQIVLRRGLCRKIARRPQRRSICGGVHDRAGSDGVAPAGRPVDHHRRRACGARRRAGPTSGRRRSSGCSSAASTRWAAS